MRKKKTAAKTKPHYFENERALRELSSMKHRDLQRACIVRGLQFNQIVDLSHPNLVSWFINNYDNTQSEDLLVEYDAWVEEELIKRGYKKGESLLAPALRFSYVGEIDTMEKPKIIKPPKAVVTHEKKPKASIDAKTGVRSGTKKAMTYELTLSDNNYTIAEIINLVIESFPEADEKSIKIWHKRALKTLQEG